MEAMTTGNKLLGQDDIDALLSQAGLEGEYEEEKVDEEAPDEKPKVLQRQKSNKTNKDIQKGG